jgi:AcrR family transcriptional regulator
MQLSATVICVPNATPRRTITYGEKAGARVRTRNSRRILSAIGDYIEATGVEQASMRQIADVAGVSVRTLYNLFGDKQGLLRAFVHRSLAEVDLAVDRIETTDPIQRTRQLTEVAFVTITESLSRSVLAPVLTDDELMLQLAARWQIRELMIEEIERAQAAGDLHHDVAADVLVDQVGPNLFHLLRLWTAGTIDDEGLVTGALRALDLGLLAVSRPHQRAGLLEHLHAR